MSIGHNAPRMTVVEWIMDVMASEMNLAEKAVTIAAVVLQTASNDVLASACNIDKRTVVRSKYRPASDGWLHIGGIKSGGRGNALTFSPGHPVYGPDVAFVYNEDAKEGQIVDLLLRRFRDGTRMPAPKGWQDAVLYQPQKRGTRARKGGDNVENGVESAPISSGDKGGEDASKGGADVENGGIMPVFGGDIGGEPSKTLESNNYPSSQGEAPAARGEPQMFGPGFEGEVFDFDDGQLAQLQKQFPELIIISELTAADKFFAREFSRASRTVPMDERQARLAQYLAQVQRRVVAERQSATARMAASNAPDGDCRFVGHRISVANGFRDELLAKVGGDEGRMAHLLDKIAGHVPQDSKGQKLKSAVLSHFVKQMDWDAGDERKIAAIERRPAQRQAANSSRIGRVFQKIANAGNAEMVIDAKLIEGGKS